MSYPIKCCTHQNFQNTFQCSHLKVDWTLRQYLPVANLIMYIISRCLVKFTFLFHYFAFQYHYFHEIRKKTRKNEPLNFLCGRSKTTLKEKDHNRCCRDCCCGYNSSMFLLLLLLLMLLLLLLLLMLLMLLLLPATMLPRSYCVGFLVYLFTRRNLSWVRWIVFSIIIIY